MLSLRLALRHARSRRMFGLSRRRRRASSGAKRGLTAWNREAVEEEIDDRGGVEREDLAEDQAADDGDAERRRSSEPVPVPSASGTPPSRAAMVVIMMGRKRSRQAW